MQMTTMEDRQRELEALLREIRDHPEHEMTEQRERARVLSEMIAGERPAGAL